MIRAEIEILLKNYPDLEPVAGEVEHELVAGFGARAVGEMEDPVGVGAVEVAVGVDHFRFNP